MSKRFITLALLVAALFSFSAGALAKTTVSLYSWWEVKPGQPLVILKEAFEKANPDIELNMVSLPADGYYDKILTMVAGGNPPDISMLAMDQLAVYASKNALTNLDPYIKKYKYPVDDLYPVVKEIVTYKGHIWALPRDVTSNAIYYNKKLFDEAGVPYPKPGWTWDDFLETAKKLTKYDANGKPIQWGFSFPTYPDGYYDWLLQNNGGFVNKDATKSIVNTPETIEALQFLQDLMYKYKVAPTPAQAQEFGSSSAAPFSQQKTAMYLAGVSRMGNFIKQGLDFDMAEVPRKKRQACRIWSNLWVIPKGAKNPDAAFRVIAWLAGPEGQSLAVDLNMGMAGLQSVGKNHKKFIDPPPANKQAYIRAFEYGVPFPVFPQSSEFFAMANRELDLVWSGQRSAKEAAAAIDKQAPAILNQK